MQGELDAKLKTTIETIRQESTDPTALSLCEKITEGLAQLLRWDMYHLSNSIITMIQPAVVGVAHTSYPNSPHLSVMRLQVPRGAQMVFR